MRAHYLQLNQTIRLVRRDGKKKSEAHEMPENEKEKAKKRRNNCGNWIERESKKELEFNKITSQKRKTFLNAIHKCSLTR